MFGEQSQYEALNAKEKKKQAAEAAKLNSASQKATKSSIPRPQKKDGPRKSTQKQTLESLLPSVSNGLGCNDHTKKHWLFISTMVVVKEITLFTFQSHGYLCVDCQQVVLPKPKEQDCIMLTGAQFCAV